MPRQLPLQRAIPQYTGAGRLRPYTSVKRRECVAKLTTHISIRGVDLKDMLQQAREQLADLSDATFTVTDVDLTSPTKRAWRGSGPPVSRWRPTSTCR
jgi:hypothetical protein